MIAADRYHRHDRAWIWDHLKPWPEHMREALAKQYGHTFKGKGRAVANTEIRELSEEITPRRLRLAADEDAIRSQANIRATECRRAVSRAGVQRSFPFLMDVAARHNITTPDPEKTESQFIAARLSDPIWWRRQLRKSHGRSVEGVARSLGLICKRKGIYASDDTVKRHQQQRSRNAAMLQAMQAVNELGQAFTLEQLATVSVSNPAIRRAELMTRIAGFEAYAEGAEHVGMFYTITCPSRFHANNQGGIRNPKWDGATPREGAAYLGRVWARIRAAWGRDGLRPYGLRVAEPHHDGTPHWHLLLFMQLDAEPMITAIIERHAMKDSPSEPGAEKYRFKAVKIDSSKGSAVGYIAKYISKNIDAYGVENDLYGKDAKDGAKRVAAWASTWGVRQFQQIGGPPVGVWRELRRVKESPAGTLEDLRTAADAGNWRAYVERMGGIVARSMMVARVYGAGAVDLDTGEIRINRYGEPAADQVRGVESAGVAQVTRLHQWRLERANSKQGESKQGKSKTCVAVAILERDQSKRGGVSSEQYKGSGRVDPGFVHVGKEASVFLSEGEAEAPWTRVNNCTPQANSYGRGGYDMGHLLPVGCLDDPGVRYLHRFRFADGSTWGEFQQLDTAERAIYAAAGTAAAANGGRNDGGGGKWYPGVPSPSGSRAAGQFGAGSGRADRQSGKPDRTA